jgi:6-phosphogluconolactonase (cycloisomerase 2 family)
MAISQNGRFLYVIDVRVGKISGFALQHDGQLLALEDAGGLPAGSVGLAAR